MALPPGQNLPYELKTATTLDSPDYDGIVLVSNKVPEDAAYPESIRKLLQEHSKIDKGFNDDVTLLHSSLPGNRFIYAPTGNMTKEYDDVRSYAEAAKKGIARALKAGITKPLLALPSDPSFPKTEVVTLLGAMEGLYTNLQYREFKPEIFPKVKVLGIWSPKLTGASLESVASAATTLESARWVARDIGGTDPERMAPPKVEEYIIETFKNTPSIKINIIKDPKILDKEYPLFSAVNRAASVVDRHEGRVIFLEYEPTSGPPTSSLFLVGKGVTYDTGGADIKTGGNMAGMARDKCGAAVVAGFMKAVAMLQPKSRVVCALAVVRNSCGENAYVSDEVVVSRAGKRIRVTNTDAEGRFAMADVLAHMAEKAKDAVNPHLFTIATLTGHACLSVGEGYSIVMDNGPARVASNAVHLSETGEEMGDPFEISRIRREDFRFHKSKCEGEDLIQSGMKSTGTNSRGHQGPGAFLICASGLDKYGLDNGNKSLKYSHFDIARQGRYPEEPTGRPVVALVSHYLKDALF
uniref:Aminopeptidase W07G4.4 n=1 Tax=Cacopsylla melanoneura TaxID=428564 RepID=A0A8D9A8R1_9HEMI